jgi:MATE family multidrug resistance protein
MKSSSPPTNASTPASLALPPAGSDLRALMHLAWPMLVAQLAQVAMGVVDTAMAGAVSATDLAAVAVGFSLWMPILLFSNGLFSAVTALIARAHGAGSSTDIARTFQQGIWLALLMSIFNTMLVSRCDELMRWMSIDPQVQPLGELYLQGMVFGAPAATLIYILRSFSEGCGRSKPAMIINVGALLLNIPLNYIFIHGLYGAPKLGGAGCGWATAIALWVNFFALAALLWPRYRQSLRGFQPPQWTHIGPMLKLGLPIAAAMFAEVSLFALVALLIGPLGATTIASHQIALNFSSLTFMVPLSLGLALTVKISNALGAQQQLRARRYVKMGAAFAVAFAVVSAAAMLLLPEYITAIYTNDPAVRALTVQLLVFAAAYQISDGLQVTASGCLRGYHDTRIVMVITLIAYWGIGLPVGYLLGLTDYFGATYGVQGFWVGLVLGLTVAAVLLNWRLWRVSHSHAASPMK